MKNYQQREKWKISRTYGVGLHRQGDMRDGHVVTPYGTVEAYAFDNGFYHFIFAYKGYIYSLHGKRKNKLLTSIGMTRMAHKFVKSVLREGE